MTVLGDDPRVQLCGFAKLVGVDVDYTARSYTITIGRKSKTPVDVALAGDDTSISRLHAQIAYSFERARWQLTVQGKNGAVLNGQLLTPTSPTADLVSQDHVQIGGQDLYFLLPLGSAEAQARQAQQEQQQQEQQQVEQQQEQQQQQERQHQHQQQHHQAAVVTAQPEGVHTSTGGPDYPAWQAAAPAAQLSGTPTAFAAAAVAPAQTAHPETASLGNMLAAQQLPGLGQQQQQPEQQQQQQQQQHHLAATGLGGFAGVPMGAMAPGLLHQQYANFPQQPQQQHIVHPPQQVQQLQQAGGYGNGQPFCNGQVESGQQ